MGSYVGAESIHLAQKSWGSRQAASINYLEYTRTMRIKGNGIENEGQG